MTLAWVRLVIAFWSLLSYNSEVQLDWSFNSECNGLCFLQIDAVEQCRSQDTAVARAQHGLAQHPPPPRPENFTASQVGSEAVFRSEV